MKPDVATGNARLRVAIAAYWTMSQEQVDAWTAYGERHPRTDPVTGAVYPSDSRNAFTGLACKLLQIDPSAELPLWPPQEGFVRQRLRITVTSGSPSFACERGGWGGRAARGRWLLSIALHLRDDASGLSSGGLCAVSLGGPSFLTPERKEGVRTLIRHALRTRRRAYV